MNGLLAIMSPGLLAVTTVYFIFLIVSLLDIDMRINIKEIKIQITSSRIYLFKGPEVIPLEKEDLKAILVATA